MEYKLSINDIEVTTDMMIANTFFSRLRGYMFKPYPHHEVICLEPCNSIHTYFMKFPIDVLFVNVNNIVIMKYEDVAPNRIIKKVKGAKKVIESKSGLLGKYQIGDIIDINF